MNYVQVWPIQTTKTVHAPAVNTAAVVTLAAPGAKLRTVIEQVLWSYNAAPTAGRLTITDGGVTVLDIDVTAAGPGAIGGPLVFAVNSAVVVTLAGAGAAVTGKVTVISRSDPSAPNVY